MQISGGFDGDEWPGSDVVRAFALKAKNLEKQFGAYTRFRTRVRNYQVGGSPESQHLISRGGTAADFYQVRGDQVPAFVEAARREGLIAVNEERRPGHGPHMHVQMYPASRAGLAGMNLAIPSRGTPWVPLGVQIAEAP